MSSKAKHDNGSYLLHIDGIRAIAFSTVLLFHFKIPGFNNGFLGVDSFLVISGFLMTRIINKDVRSGTFSMTEFIKKRFWRLYPSLITTVAFTSIAGHFMLSNRLIDDLVKSAQAAIFFLSNIYYSKDYRYFGLRSQYRPLLHIWSLSLEEQFYIVWPLILLLLNSFEKKIFRRRWQYDVSVLFMLSISLALNFALEFKHGNFVFYWLPSRFYEFLIGAMLSFHFESLNQKFSSVFLSNFLSAIGLILFYLSVINCRWSRTPVPNFISCISTTLLILSPDSFFSRNVLCSKLLIFIGKLSYAAYLIHWPLWVLYGTLNAFQISVVEKIWLIAAVLLFAIILRKYIEQPFRHKRSRTSQIYLVSILLLVLSLEIFNSYSYEEDGTGKLQYRKRKSYSRISCKKLSKEHKIFRKFRNSDPIPQACYIGNNNTVLEDTGFSAVLVGSSFAEHLVPGLRLLAVEKNMTFLVLSSKNCAYQSINNTGSFRKFPYTAQWCFEENKRRNKLLKSLGRQHIILSDFILLRFAGFGFRVLKGNDVFEHPTKGAFAYFKSSCNALLGQGHVVSFLGDTPFISYETFEAVISNVKLAKMNPFGRKESLHEMLSWRFSLNEQHSESNNKLIKFFDVEERVRACKMVDMMKEFCRFKDKKLQCDFFDAISQLPLYTDGAHLSVVGAWKTRKKLFKTILQY